MSLSHIFFFAALVTILAVLATMFRGLFAMAKGHQKDHKTSNKMMQLRVFLQGTTILLLILSYLTK